MTIFGLCSLCAGFSHFHNVPLPVAPGGANFHCPTQTPRDEHKHTQNALRNKQMLLPLTSNFQQAEFTALNLSNYKRQNKVTSQHHRQHYYLHTSRAHHFRENCSFESKRAQLFATRLYQQQQKHSRLPKLASALKPATPYSE
jgi:hypothetical protein